MEIKEKGMVRERGGERNGYKKKKGGETKYNRGEGIEKERNVWMKKMDRERDERRRAGDRKG